MNNKVFFTFLLFIAFVKLPAQVGIGTIDPNDSAQLDVVANDKGVLIPRVNLVKISQYNPIAGTAVNSLLVYNTNTNTSVSGEEAYPGYYYWYEGRWNRVISKSDFENKDIVKSIFEGSNIIIYDPVTNQFNYYSGSGVKQVGIANVINNTTSTTQIAPRKIAGKNLSSTGSLLITNGAGAVLTSTTIDIADGGVRSNHLSANSVSTTNIISGGNSLVMVTDAGGNVKWIPQKELVSGNYSITTVSATNGLSVTSSATASGTEYVVEIANGGIQSNHLASNSVSTTNIISGANNTIMVTSGTTAMWVDKDDYIKGSQSVTVVEDGKNTTVSSTILGNVTTYKVDVATASGTTLGLVKETSANPTVNINSQGELSINQKNLYVIKKTNTDYTITNESLVISTAVGTSSKVDITLPDATLNAGRKITIKKDAGMDEDAILNIKTQSSQQILGVVADSNGVYLSTAVPYTGWELVSNGTEWYIVNKF